METQIILDISQPYILLAIGITLIALETFVSLISMVLIFAFRNKFMKKTLESQIKVSDDFFNEEGIGEIKNSKVFYKGTYWEIDPNINKDDFKEDEKIIVSKIFKNNVTIKKKN